MTRKDLWGGFLWPLEGSFWVTILIYNLPQVWNLWEGFPNGRLTSRPCQGRQFFHNDVVGAFN
jgi:hypothetical protein